MRLFWIPFYLCWLSKLKKGSLLITNCWMIVWHIFWNIRESLYVADQYVVMYDDRVIKVSRSANPAFWPPGDFWNEASAQALLFWPGISSDIKQTREECPMCCKNAPSQPALPALLPDYHLPLLLSQYLLISLIYLITTIWWLGIDCLVGWRCFLLNRVQQMLALLDLLPIFVH